MNYCKIMNNDIANGVGIRVSLFVSGCTNHCDECFQPETWDFGYGDPFTKDTENEIVKMLSQKHISGLTLLGGEPLEPRNQRGLLRFVQRVKKELPHKTIWCYTGFTYEKLKQEGSYCRCEITDDLLSYIDVLVDGRFVKQLASIGLWFKGSANQRVIDLKKTEQTGVVCEIQKGEI